MLTVWGQISMALTVSGEELPEVDGDRQPILADDGFPVAPDTDIHGASPWLRGQPCEVDGLFGEVVHAPALTLISGEPDRKAKNTKGMREKIMIHFDTVPINII